MTPDWLVGLNTFAWVFTNLIVAYIAVVLVGFVLAYYAWFDPRATTAGKYVFRFILSLIGVIGLVFVSLFVDPAMGRKWFEYPGDILWWRPAVRLVIYGYVAFTVTGLAVVVMLRKWKPSLLRTAKDHDLVQPRS